MITSDRSVPPRPVALGAVAAVVVASLVALAPVDLAAAAPRAHAASACSGTITLQFGGVRQTASGIMTGNVTCAAGRGVVRTFLQRANSQPRCRSAALRPPPTSGCVVSGYNCFLRSVVNYCATPNRRDVSFRLRVASTGCAIARRDRPFYQGITARGVTCADAHAAVRAFLRLFPEPARRFRAAGRQWTWHRTLLRGHTRMRTHLHSGRAEVIFLSLPFS